MTDIGVFIVARNEEKHIKKTLTSLIDQDLKPKIIILIDDNSTDKTKEIAKNFKDIKIIDFPFKHPNWLMSTRLAEVFNCGFSEIKKSGKYDYVMRVDSDNVLPTNYLSTIISEMNKDENIVVASGIIKGEEQFANIRGSGRIHRTSYLDLIDWKHPVRHGFESYIFLKAESLGFSTKVFNIFSETQRPTDTLKKKSEILIVKGKAYRSYGYILPWVLAYAFRKYKINPKSLAFFLFGYLAPGTLLYEKEFRDYFSKKQWNAIKNFFVLKKEK